MLYSKGEKVIINAGIFKGITAIVIDARNTFFGNPQYLLRIEETDSNLVMKEKELLPMIETQIGVV